MSSAQVDRGHQAFRLLQIAFVIVPILMGLDKFFFFLTNWNHYLSPVVAATLGSHVRGFFMVVGVIEVIAGLGVLIWPRVFAYIVFIWLIVVALNLLHAGFFDVALRDVGLLLGALSLAKLSEKYNK